MPHTLPVAAQGCAPPEPTHPDGPSALRREGRDFLPPRSLLFHEGFPAAPQYRLLEGCVALSQSLPDGRRQIIDIIGPGRLVGFSFGDRNRATAETLTYCHIEPVRDLTATDLQQLLRETVVRAESHATLLGRKTAPERVASAILDLSREFLRTARGHRAALVFNLYLTRGELADWLGLTVETVSRCFHRLKRAGIIAFDDPEIVTVLDPALLGAIADGQRSLQTLSNPRG